jgi:hypothetical protein
MIDIRYFLARQKTAQKGPVGSPQQKQAPASSTARPVISAWPGLRYLGFPDEPLPNEPAYDFTQQNHPGGCES